MDGFRVSRKIAINGGSCLEDIPEKQKVDKEKEKVRAPHSTTNNGL